MQTFTAPKVVLHTCGPSSFTISFPLHCLLAIKFLHHLQKRTMLGSTHSSCIGMLWPACIASVATPLCSPPHVPSPHALFICDQLPLLDTYYPCIADTKDCGIGGLGIWFSSLFLTFSFLVHHCHSFLAIAISATVFLSLSPGSGLFLGAFLFFMPAHHLLCL